MLTCDLCCTTDLCRSGWFPSNHVEAIDAEESPYEDPALHGLPRLGIYEDVMGAGGASEGQYECVNTLPSASHLIFTTVLIA